MNIANEIIDRLTMQEVFSRYGFEPDRKGNICCPFHNERQPSLGFYAGGKRWHCFGCSEGGSAIDFVIKLFNLTFKQAIAKLDYDFGLGIVGQKLTYSERERARKAETERKRRAEAQKRIREEKETAYRDALGTWVKNDEITRRYKGTSKCAFDYPKEYWRALLCRQYAAYLLDSMER